MNRQPHTSEVPTPRYSAVDETKISIFEGQVFNMSENAVRPPEGSTEQLIEAYQAMQKAKQKLTDEIRKKRVLFGFDNKPITVKINEQSEEIQITLDRKNQDRNYDFAEKHYLETVMAFNYMSTLANQNEEDKRKYLISFHQAQSVFLAFQTFVSIRSFMHKDKKGNLRDSGEVKVQHVYEVAVHQMNRYLEKLETTKNEDEYLKIIEEMQFSVVVALLHDFLEDHEEIDPDALWQVLESRTRYDSTLIILINNHQRASGLKPVIPNFFRDNKDEILERMRALKKPDPDQRQGYLRRQIFQNPKLSNNAKVDLIIAKLCDRQNNLESLAYMKDKLNEKGEVVETGYVRQTRKLKETEDELLPLAEDIYNAFKDTDTRHVEDIPSRIEALKLTYEREKTRLQNLSEENN